MRPRPHWPLLGLLPGLLLPLACTETPAPRAPEPVVVASRASTDVREDSELAPRGPVARAALAERAPIIDGRLDEAAWQRAPAQTGFFQREPREGEPPRFPTEFRVVYDDRSVYVAVRAHDPDPSRIVGRLTRRDESSASDWITVSFDSYRDKRTAFSFALNAAGVQRDFLTFNELQEDVGWNAVWEGAARIDEGGWVAEMRIPFSQLRYATEAEAIWGLQVTRMVQRANEHSTWAPQPRDSSQGVSLFGRLQGFAAAPTRRFELIPYAVAGGSLAAADAGDPLNDDLEPVLGAGLDFRYGLGSSTTLSGAINPDFGQVEADPSQVNLSANEIFFAEKRPFFLEGTDIFAFQATTNDGAQAPQLFYSRRIGAAPHGSATGVGVYVDEPASSTILGAAKISGKTASGWSYGVLEALTAEESASFIDAAGEPGELVIEPLTNYSLLRLKKDLGAGQTSLGAVVTGVHRHLADTGLEELHSQAYSAGLQLRHRWGESGWLAKAGLLASHVRGAAEAIDATQRGPQRYFQRPDADHLDYDPTRTSLTGGAAYAEVGKFSQGHWRYSAGFDSMSPAFAANDLGFHTNADFTTGWLWGQYWDGEVGDAVRDWQVNTTVWSIWDYAPEQMARGFTVNASATASSYWGGHVGFEIGDILQGNRDLRGGPLLRRDTVLNQWGGLVSDSRRAITGTLNYFTWWAPANGSRGGSIDPAVAWQARPNLSLSLGPSFGYVIDDNLYVAEVADGAGDPHYVMARIEQVTTALTVRASYTLSPTISLQLYAQPFVATGAYDEIKEVEDAQAADYDDRYHVFAPGEISEADGVISIDRDGDGAPDFSIGRPDFSFGQLRSTLVGRWEYLPGSSLFVIWNHNRTAAEAEGRFRFDDDYGALAKEQGEHVLLLKLSYWLGG